jgi:hypothetical protein
MLAIERSFEQEQVPQDFPERSSCLMFPVSPKNVLRRLSFGTCLAVNRFDFFNPYFLNCPHQCLQCFCAQVSCSPVPKLGFVFANVYELT